MTVTVGTSERTASMQMNKETGKNLPEDVRRAHRKTSPSESVEPWREAVVSKIALEIRTLRK